MNKQDMDALTGILNQQSQGILKAVDEKITKALTNSNPFKDERPEPVKAVKAAPKKAPKKATTITSAPLPKLDNQPEITEDDHYYYYSGRISKSAGPTNVTGAGREKWESKSERGADTSCYVMLYTPAQAQ